MFLEDGLLDMNNNWYKKAQFGTDPFGGSHLSDKTKSSPWGFAGGDEKTGIFEPSSGKHHPNNLMSEETQNFLTEKQLEEEKKKKRKNKNKKKKMIKVKRKTQAGKDFNTLTPNEMSSVMNNLAGELKKRGENQDSNDLIHLLNFMPIAEMRIKDCSDEKVIHEMEKNCQEAYGEFIPKAKIKIEKAINHLGITLSDAVNGDLMKEGQWGSQGPKMPTWGGEDDWVLNTYKEIMGGDKEPAQEPAQEPIEEKADIETLLNATVTVNSMAGNSQETGSAFFIGPNKMLTCYHVTSPEEGAPTRIIVKYGENEYEASVISSDPSLDVAILAINDPGFSVDNYLKIGNSNDIMQGEKIFIIGTPLGFENVVGEGIVSSTPVDYSEEGSDRKYIFISTNINPGNSGGPVIKESDGTVIGIAAAVITTEQSGNSGLNAAIPIDDIKEFLKV